MIVKRIKSDFFFASVSEHGVPFGRKKLATYLGAGGLHVALSESGSDF